ncbi:MAG: hypothetical protein V3U02_12015, partial [Calditrichia bacterium]
LAVVSLSHLLGHVGIRRTRIRVSTYYHVRKLDLIVSTLVNSCKACQMNTLHINNAVEAGLTTKEYAPNQTWHMDLVSLPRQTFDGKMMSGFLMITDLATHFCHATMIGTQNVQEVINILRKVCFKFNLPHNLASDSGSQLLGSPLVRSFLHQCHVTTIRQIAFNVHSHGTVEKENQTLRRLLKNNQTAFKDKWTNIFDLSVYQMNMAPRKLKAYNETTEKFDPMYLSPMEVLFGCSNDGFEQFVTQQFTAKDRAVYNNIIKSILKRSVQMQKQQQEIKDAAREQARPNKFHVGQMVLYRALPYDKKKLTYRENLFIIISMRHRKVILSPIYGPRRQIMAHLKNIKRVTSDPEMIAKLPISIQKFFTVISTDPQALSNPPSWLKSYHPPAKPRPKTRAAKKAEQEAGLQDEDSVQSVSSDNITSVSVFADEEEDAEIPISILHPAFYEEAEEDKEIPHQGHFTPPKEIIPLPPSDPDFDAVCVERSVAHLPKATVILPTLATMHKPWPTRPISEISQDIPIKIGKRRIMGKMAKGMKNLIVSPIKKLLSPHALGLRRGTRPRRPPAVFTQ